MAFSQMLAIISWSNKLQYILDKKNKPYKCQKMRNDDEVRIPRLFSILLAVQIFCARQLKQVALGQAKNSVEASTFVFLMNVYFLLYISITGGPSLVRSPLKAIHFVNSVCRIFSLWKKDPPHQTFPS